MADFAIRINGEPIRVYLGENTAEAARQAAIATAAAGLVDGATAIGSLSETNLFRSTINGAYKDGLYKVVFPAGTSGQNSYIQPQWAFDGAANVGRVVKIRLGFDRSATFTRTWTRVMQIRTAAQTNSTRTGVTTITSSAVGNRYYVNFEYTIQGDEIDLRPYIIEQSAAATAAQETIEITDFSVEYQTALSDVRSPIAEALDERDDRMVAETQRVTAQEQAPAAAHKKTLAVASTGGDYTTVAAALAVVTDANPDNRYRLKIPVQTLDDGAEWEDKDFVDIVGVSRKESILRFHQANNVNPALGASESLVLMRHSSRIEGLTMTAKNARYVIHLESDGNYPNRVQEIVNCHIEHLGNDDLIGNYWGAQYAIGSGNSSGQVIRIVDSTLVSKRKGGFSYHTNKDFAAPSRTELIRSRFIALAAGEYSFSYKSLGSFQPDVCYAEGCVFGGDIAHQPVPWLQTALSKQPADHNEIRLTGHGNSPAVFINEDFGECLRIDSATTGASSSVAILGNAVQRLFGDGTNQKYSTRAGSAGFSAAVWGWGDISTQAVGLNQNVQTKSLAQRLGDRTGGNAVTLEITIDGGAPVTLIFNQNYTGQTNQDIIDLINSALGSAGVASIYKPGARVRPMFADEECAPKNTSGSGIPFGTVCAFNNSFDGVRPMTSADAAHLFAGVAWEDIADGDRGRVKCKGYLPLTDVLRNASVGSTVAFDTTFSIDPATPGQVVTGGTQGLLRAIRNNAVKVG